MFPFQISNLLGFIKTNNFSCSTAIDEKLNKPNCTLEELLDEEEIIQEMKYQNIKLLNFFDKDRVKKLLDYILIEPKEDDYKKAHRYPFIASEILNSDSNKIYDLFFNKMNPNKNSVDISQNKSIEINEKRGKENDMDSFSFDEKKDNASNKDSNNFRNDTNPIMEEVPLSSSQEINDLNITQVPKTEKIEAKLEELHIKQDVDVNMNIDDKQGGNNVNNEDKNKLKCNEDTEVKDGTTQNYTLDDKIVVDVEPNETKTNEVNSLQNDPKEDIKMRKESVNQEKKIEEKKEIDLLDYFLSFLDSDQPLNYVLCGYFAKFFTFLLNKNSSYMLHYIWEKRNDVLNKLLYHCNRKSLAELLVRIIQVETIDLELSHQGWFREIRHKFLSEFVLKLRSNDLEEVDNTIWVLSDIIDNRSLLEFALENKTFLRTLFENISQKDVSVLNFVETINLVILVNKFCWVENFYMPVYAPSTDESLVSYNEKEIIHSDLSLLNKNYLVSILYHFNNESESNENKQINLETTYGSFYKPLGNKRIKVVEYLLTVFNLMKTAIHEIDALLVDKDNELFFITLFNLFFEYEWNSFYQHHFEALLNFIFSNTQGFPLTIKYLFGDLKLINYLLEKSKLPKFIFNSNRKMNHGFWANFIELCSKINSITDSEVTKHFTDEWKVFIKDKVEYWKNLFSRQLSAVVKNNFNFNFDDKQMECQNTNNNNPKFSYDNKPQEENKSLEFNPQTPTDFFNNIGTTSDTDWLNNYSSKSNNDPSKFDKELENFEFFEDKKTENNEGSQEGQSKDQTTQKQPDIATEQSEDNKENNPIDKQNSEKHIVNDEVSYKFEDESSVKQFEKKDDIFSFEDTKVEKKEDFAKEVDKMLSEINK